MLKKARKCLALIVRAHQNRLRLANGWKTLAAFARRQGRAWKVWIHRMGAELRPAAAETAARLKKTGARLMLSARALWNRTQRETLPLAAAKGREIWEAVRQWCRAQAEEAKIAAPVVLARAKAFGGQLSRLAAGRANVRADLPALKRHAPRRAMAMILAVMVTLSRFPAGAFADEIDGKDSGSPMLLSAEGLANPSDEARWGLAKSDGSAPDTWVDSGTLANASFYECNLRSGTAYIQLQNNVQTIGVSFANNPTILDLNGKTIDCTNSDAQASALYSNDTLILKDTCQDGGGKITGGDKGVWVQNGSFTMTGGEISGNTGSGGVAVSTGNFTMTGGSITGNTATHSGGGVSMGSSGNFTMTGGSILLPGTPPHTPAALTSAVATL